jgi:hypothetical protein
MFKDPGGIDPVGAHHEGHPRIGKKHEYSTDRIEYEPDGKVNPLQKPLLHGTPTEIRVEDNKREDKETA